MTLSTFHGCPPGEVFGITEFLLKGPGLHCTVKLNPMLLGPEDTRALLVAYGLPVVPERTAAGPDEAAAAAAGLGFPAGVKTALPGAHKTETGGVALDLADAEAVRTAAARSSSPASCRIPSLVRSSPSGRAASSPS